MKSADGQVVYVGKAANLPDRVSSYFVPSADLGPKKQLMLDVVTDFDVIACETEWEALLTESRLIKDLKPSPRFNVRLKDGKTFPYLGVTMREDYPRVLVTRNPADPLLRGGRVFGPFTNAGSLREAVQILQGVFRFRTCSIDITAGDPRNRFFRPCLLHAIDRCTAPCAERISPDAYAADIDRLLRFLTGKRSAMLRELRQAMEQAAAEQRFEQAAALRDRLRALERLDQRADRRDGWQPETEIAYQDPARGGESLARLLGLDAPVRCIEGLDIAHLQGGQTVGSTVCFIDGRPFKEGYRRFKVRTAANDDFAALREVVSRRYREAGAGHELYPDVILIDGGLGQLRAALEALDGLSHRPPMVIALAKRQELIYVQGSSEPLRASRSHAGLRLCQAVRDEAHRFAQAYHHLLRRTAELGEPRPMAAGPAAVRRTRRRRRGQADGGGDAPPVPPGAPPGAPGPT
jgi:excinuclease ABC subunit C